MIIYFVVFGCLSSAFANTILNAWPGTPYPETYYTANDTQLSTTRIVHGSPAKSDQFPWFVSIRSHSPNGLQSICGGSLIAPVWVLTAAHCTKGYVAYTLGFGSTNLNTPTISLNTQHVIEHSQYNKKYLNYDIALLGLPTALTYSANIQAIRLPTLQQAMNGQFYTTKARTCGYGRTSDVNPAVSPTLNWVDKRLISNTQCAQTYGPFVVISSTLCTIGWDFNAQSTCNGDSGGPLVIDEGGLWTQVGIVSFVSNQGCTSGHPSGYIRTTSFLNWIAINTGIPIRT